MPHPRLSRKEIAHRGQELYDREIRSKVEFDANIGKIVSIDVETGDYELDETGLEGAARLQARRPGAAVYGIRIGYNAVYSFGGALTRVGDE